MIALVALPLSAAFLLGVLWRLFSRASKAYRSKLRAYPSRWAFVKNNWDVFLLRTVPFNSGAFAVWLLHPDWLSKGLILVRVPVGIANWMIVTPNLATAFAFGFLVDYGLDQVQLKLAAIPVDKWPAWLPDAIKGEIPCYDQAVVNGAVFVQTSKRDTGIA